MGLLLEKCTLNAEMDSNATEQRDVRAAYGLNTGDFDMVGLAMKILDVGWLGNQNRNCDDIDRDI